MDTRDEADDIAHRVLAAPTASEVAALTVGIALTILVFPPMSNSGLDWATYLGAVDGDHVVGDGLAWYYPYWWLWPLEAITALGDTTGYVTLGVLNLLGIFFAARVFGGHPALALMAYHTLMVSFTGTITGVLAAVVAGLWWALRRRQMVAAGVLAAFALAKAGWGIPLVLAMVAVTPATWRERARGLAAASVVAAASVAVYGWWPADVVDRVEAVPPAGNGSLWHFVGPAVLVLWIPVLVVRMDPRTRVTAVATTAILAAPYVQQYDFALLFTLGHSWIGLVSWARPALVALGGTEFARAVLTAIPAAYYVLVLAALRRPRTGAQRPRSAARS